MIRKRGPGLDETAEEREQRLRQRSAALIAEAESTLARPRPEGRLWQPKATSTKEERMAAPNNRTQDSAAWDAWASRLIRRDLGTMKASFLEAFGAFIRDLAGELRAKDAEIEARVAEIERRLGEQQQQQQQQQPKVIAGGRQ